jgi:hypothetical protein
MREVSPSNFGIELGLNRERFCSRFFYITLFFDKA